MLFSAAYEVQRTELDDWFDPLLNLDTKLFIDPFLLYDNETDQFVGSHAEVIQFFNSVLILIAGSGGNSNSASWRRAVSLLHFPEVQEICLGYTALGTGGSGSGSKTADRLARGLLKAVEAGTVHLSHFEEVQILQDGIGADRISDATATLIRHRLASYTATVCERHNIPTRELRTDRGIYDPSQGRWLNRTFMLPRNPINGLPVLLVPLRYLRNLPTINPDDFWDYCYDNDNETLRQRYGDDINRNVNKQVIIELALAAPQIRARYQAAREAEGSDSYDIDLDPQGLYQPAVQAHKWAAAHPRAMRPQSDAELAQVMSELISEFRNYVENQRGWILLWNDHGTPKGENSFQALFMQTVATHCRANNIDVSAEANIGRGPVDFKMSVGYFARVLVEAKLARNTKFWRGLERQLPKYLEAEGVSEGFFVVCVQSDEDIMKLEDINTRVAQLNVRLPFRIRVVTVDARKDRPSASLL